MKKLLLTMMLVLGVSASVVALDGVGTYALDPGAQISEGVKGAGGGSGGDAKLKNGLEDVINVLLFVLGAIAVIMIVVGGIKYTLSNGDSGQVTSAKNTILYAIVGLVVALLAYAIVNFVIAQF